MRDTGDVLHVRLVVPEDLRSAVDEVLEASDAVSNVVVLPGAARRPQGDVVLCDVERDAASPLLAALHDVGLGDRGSISAEHLDLAIDPISRRRQRLRFGGEDDAVVWEEVEARTNDEVRLSGTFLAFMTVATMIAAVGVVSDQPILIVGAMVVGPDFGPLAALSVGLVRRRWKVVLRSAATLLTGYVFAIVVTIGFAELLKLIGVFPENPFAEEHPLTEFIWQPDALSYVVAFLAGIAGMLSLTSAKSGALIGVLISVTTVPAAGAIALAVTAGEWDQVRTSTMQLGINLSSIVLGAVLTLVLQLALLRLADRRRQRVAVTSGS
ncbi:TIGR00341 family protein [Agromyces sp. MMS24-K17]|uniref:TIGR00341 family protein n=1 Tax=Agromyces sp. MMS24-K17 TaxID=3372850 RepID=UPI0037543E96